MRKAVILALGLLATAPAQAGDFEDIVGTVRHYAEAYNNHNAAAWAALCTDKTVIVDNFGQNVWQGATSCADWYRAQTGLNASNGVTNGGFRIGQITNVVGTDGHAYLVVPVDYTYTGGGKSDSIPGLWTVTLIKTPAGWRITSWTWTDR